MAADEEDGAAHVQRPSNRKSGAKTARKSRDGGSRTGKDAQRPAHRASAARIMRNAAEQLQELLGRAPESVSAVKPTEDGWQADVEVLELERIPATTSVMASYRVTLDEEGELVAYERTRRYTRGQIDPRT
ncbi:gas vesicle protein GvpO [Streptomyces chattanoogensis]|uniref:Gas vesicle protein n=1 Tax=Streptomyces chattanoogensis TaxID=66876 RepID=A0A0N0XUK1_9ACTN|nr:gas vesicle protein [Streptomyces chattanoogensis]AJT61951.1 hypothetical protein T261_0260 [Streptomyces lydicus]KPC60816.1 gas vesicle protein [Streptomyces chattanoogensis]